MNEIYKISTLLLIGVEGYSTPLGKRDRRDPARSVAEEAARRSPTGSFALRESEAAAIKRVAWDGNHLYSLCHNILKDDL